MALTQKIANYDEYIVGANHPTLLDTHNRDMLIDHDQYGGHVRFSVTDMTNNTGGARSPGDVVAMDFASAGTFTTPSGSDTRPLFVVCDSPAVGDYGYLCGMGVINVNVVGSVTAGNYLRASATACKAEDAGSTPSDGCFARARASGSGSVPCLVGPLAMISVGFGGGGGGTSVYSGEFTGLQLSRASSTSISVAAGAAASDDTLMTSRELMVLSAAMTGTLTGSWASGSGNGKIDIGAVAANEWYHVFLIRSASNTDILFSTSPTSPTMPGGYSKKVWIGAFRTDGVSQVKPFLQQGNFFRWMEGPQQELGGVAQTVNTWTTRSLSYVPDGIRVTARVRVGWSDSLSVDSVFAATRPVDATDGNPSENTNVLAIHGEGHEITNTSAQIQTNVGGSSLSGFYLSTVGWYAPLGAGGGSTSSSGGGTTLIGFGSGTGGSVYDSAYNMSVVGGTAEVNLYSKNVLANTVKPKSKLRGTIIGRMTDTTGNANFGIGPITCTIRIKMGGITLFTFTSTTSNDNPEDPEVLGDETRSSIGADVVTRIVCEICHAESRTVAQAIMKLGSSAADSKLNAFSTNVNYAADAQLIVSAQISYGTALCSFYIDGIQWELLGVDNEVSVLDADASNVDATNTTTETTLYTETIAAGMLGTKGRIELPLQMELSDNNGSFNGSVTFRLKYGTTTVAALTWPTGTGASEIGLNQAFVLTAMLSADGSNSAQVGHLKGEGPYAESALSEVIHGTRVARGTAAEASSADKTLSVTAQWNAASTSRSAVVEHALLKRYSAS